MSVRVWSSTSRSMTTRARVRSFVEACPKSMVFGPCGGVTAIGGCEVDSRPCPFVTEGAPPWRRRPHEPRPPRLPDIVVDIRPDPSASDFDESIDILVDAGVGGLIGDHVDDPAHVSVPDVVSRVAARGLTVTATVACRNRSVRECRKAIGDLVDAGADAILCVTGDHPAARFGPDATATFALDGTRLAALARSLGGYVAVAESPGSSPVHRRAWRLAQKQRAGADVAILNHCGGLDELERFAADATECGVTMAVAAPVPVISDLASLHALTSFPGLLLPPELVRAFRTARDPELAGIDSAITFGRQLRAGGRFTHLNLSGRATEDGQLARCRIMAEVAVGIRQP
ncbi:methylenetetrahydrofolate reductase C-terminal domain-containing protein [Ilumatobacter sp.]|uniref:methylenetetrahydrofolate reductase n=1 Tax=Ilumatobacter sp. TaxID=1967498 RepID=UPI003C5DE3B2